MLIVAVTDPLEPLPREIDLIQRRICSVKIIDIPKERFKLLMAFIIENLPAKLFFVIPLVKLTELRAHESELLSRMSHHVADECFYSGKFHFVVARHFVHERTFSVNYLVMAYREHEILTESIDERECQIVMVIRPIDRIKRKIPKHIVHPAHIPFVAEAQSSHVGRTGNHRKSGGLFGNHDIPREKLVTGAVKLFDKLDSLHVFFSSEDIRHPLAVFSVVVKIQHRRYGINTNTVNVIFIHPEHSARYQEADNLIAAVVINESTPLFVFALSPVLVLIAASAVKAHKPVRILREMSGNPVKYNSQTCPVSLVDKIHEIMRCAIT